MHDFSVIKTLRRKRNLSADELAARSGLTRATVTKMEAGDGNPTVDTLRALAQALGMSASDLMRLAENEGLRRPEVSRVRRAHYQGRRYRLGSLEFFRITAEAEHTLQFDTSWHEDTGEVILLLRGRLLLRVSEQEHELRPGQAIGFKALYEHQLRVLENSEMVIIHHSLI